ncbi:MAG: hypothetical protein KF838_13570 [Phycisphaeraceae bacterium]|nr:MAG: hypothetical protein KF838_13570 [Phycisphaeraceae bacterium]
MGGTAEAGQSGDSISRDTDPLRVSAPTPSVPPASPPRHTLDDAEWADPQYRKTRGTNRKPRNPSPPPSAPSRSPVSVRGIPRIIPFNPSPEQIHDVLNDIVSPYASLADVAANNNTTVHALSAWIALAETQTMLDQIEQAAYRRARVSAACLLTDAVNSLSFTLRAHVDAESNEPLGRSTEALHIRQRQRTDARKASWLLYRIARAYPAIPIDPTTLRFIHTLKRERDASPVPSRSAPDHSRVPLVPGSDAQRQEPEPVPMDTTSPSRVACLHEVQACAEPTGANNRDASSSHRTANVSERMSESPSQPVDPAGALQDLPPASSPKDDADSQVQACSDEHTCAQSASSPSPDSPHGCASAAMPPDSASSPSIPLPLCPSAPSPQPPSRAPPG